MKIMNVGNLKLPKAAVITLIFLTIHRYTGNADTKDTQDVLPVCFSSIKDGIDCWIPEKGGVNNEHMFNICRLLKTAEREIRRSLELYEIRQVLITGLIRLNGFSKRIKRMKTILQNL